MLFSQNVPCIHRCYRLGGHTAITRLARTKQFLFCPAEAVEGQDGSYEWAPKGLKPFDLPAPTAGGDVAAVKAGHVSISAMNTGFIQPKM